MQALHGLSRLSAWSVDLGIVWNEVDRRIPRITAGTNRLHRDIAEKLESLGQGATPEALEVVARGV